MRIYIYVALIFICSVLSAGIYYYVDSNKYSIVSTGSGFAYKLDKKTGQVWFITPKDIREVSLASKPRQETKKPIR